MIKYLKAGDLCVVDVLEIQCTLVYLDGFGVWRYGPPPDANTLDGDLHEAKRFSIKQGNTAMYITKSHHPGFGIFLVEDYGTLEVPCTVVDLVQPSRLSRPRRRQM